LVDTSAERDLSQPEVSDQPRGRDMSAIPEMLTVDEAAEKLRRTPRHVRYMLRKGQIAGRKLVSGGPWLIDKMEVMRQLGAGVGAGTETTANSKNSVVSMA
jgi:excisionase family DNA binding protein